MSERKSWDVVRKPVQARPAAAPEETGHPVATHAPKLSNGPRRGTKKPAPARPLREKRKKQERFYQVFLILLLLALVAGAFYLLWLPALRVNTIDAQGPDADGGKQITASVIEGTYWYVFPRNSIFMLPESDIRAPILKQYPDIEAISIKSTSLHGIDIIATPRQAAFIWCGVSVNALDANGSCFDADADGLLFAPSDPSLVNASSTLRIFAPLDRDVAIDSSPVRAHVVASKQIPDALRLVKALRDLGAPVTSLSIQGDEGDLYLNGKTRVLYVLGHEEQAAELAASTFPTLNLMDGTIDYVDLRFVSEPNQPGKVYVKRFGQ
ncbi:MAG: hypothetical protein JWM39_512 [Parcubacteria group bacterium]|nr:hypothetical protein [Parcubacteria group bacterium]